MKNVYNSIMHELKRDRFHEIELSGTHHGFNYYIEVYGDEINFSITHEMDHVISKFSTSITNVYYMNGYDAFIYFLYNMYNLNKYDAKDEL